MNALFSLVLIFSPNVDNWTEERYLDNLSFAQCDAAQKAVWAENWETVGVDAEGRAIPEVDAYCIESAYAPENKIASYSMSDF